MTRLPIVLLLATAAMMDWNAFGVVAAGLWGGLLLALGVRKIFNAESQSRRGRREGFELGARPPDPVNLCVLSALAVLAVLDRAAKAPRCSRSLAALAVLDILDRSLRSLV